MYEVAFEAVPSTSLSRALGTNGGVELALGRLRGSVGDRRLWHINSTSRGGGVAELLSTLLPYLTGAGMQARWLVIEADGGFFEVTKRLHNWLHGGTGEGGGLGDGERSLYDSSLESEFQRLRELVAPGDVAMLHDPQTAGLIRPLKDLGVTVLWRCHVGTETPTAQTRSAWQFLWEDVSCADQWILSRNDYAWEQMDQGRIGVISPCIDVCSPKNMALDPERVDAVLAQAGLVASSGARTGHWGRSTAEVIEDAAVPRSARLVVQVSRWDGLKDPVGVLRSFIDHGPADPGTHLVLAGPQVGEVDDDPESAEVFGAVRDAWTALPRPDRALVHLALLPMDDLDWNSRIVNALQRRADVVVQKSLAEGFGLTVTEAMWKARAVVASKVGGIQDQIEHGRHGLLIDDPTDLETCGAGMARLLDRPIEAQQLGKAARERVLERFLPVQHFEAEAEVIDRVS